MVEVQVRILEIRQWISAGGVAISENQSCSTAGSSYSPIIYSVGYGEYSYVDRSQRGYEYSLHRLSRKGTMTTRRLLELPSGHAKRTLEVRRIGPSIVLILVMGTQRGTWIFDFYRPGDPREYLKKRPEGYLWKICVVKSKYGQLHFTIVEN